MPGQSGGHRGNGAFAQGNSLGYTGVVTGEHLYLAFVLATVVLALMPGPNVALITASSLAHGPRHGLLTVAGTTAAIVLQLALTAIGMATLLDRMASVFEWVRWIGVAYLVYLGVRCWVTPAPAATGSTGPQPRSARAVLLRGFFVSLTNPKTLFFFGAFLPQFIEPGGNYAAQVVRLCVTFLVIAVAIDSGWALLAGYARGVLAGRETALQRVTGTLLIGASVGLALARRR